MAGPDIEKRLAAILAADVSGYTRLMADDERATIETIADYRVRIRAHIDANGGRVVDMAGDSVLAVFASTEGAVAAAVATQEELRGLNAVLPDARRMHFRIGVNLGDIQESADGTVYGEGVNIAARLEGLAEPGGIMVSEDAWRQVRRNPGLDFEDAGLHGVKNVEDPVHAFRLILDGTEGSRPRSRRPAIIGVFVLAAILVSGIIGWQWMKIAKVETASLERMAYPLPKEPSIAVLPFDDLSATDEHDFIADGLSENIIATLSQVRGMLVIARNSTFTYKDQPVKVQEVAEALGVRYVLEGSTQVAGERLRVTAQLVDALTGNHLWSERYDRTTDNVFAVQDDITLNVVTALQVELTEGPHAIVWHGGTENLEAWSLFQRGREHLLHFTSADLAEARRLFEQAIAIDPTFALALAHLGNTHRLEVPLGFSANPEKSLDMALSFAEQAVAIDQESPDAHVILAMVFRNRHDFKRAMEQVEIALRLGPNHGYVLAMAAINLSRLGHSERAIALMEQAMRLSPNYLNWYPMVVAESHLFAGRHAMALDALKAAGPDIAAAWRDPIQIAALGGLGREQEARRAVAEHLEDTPGFSISSHRAWLEGPGAFAPDVVLNRVGLLRAAGVPEYAPGAAPERPVIAVLPFDNLSGDPEQDYFADGITEDIITRLSRFPRFFVIARNSTYQYKGQAVDIRQVGRDLGANYVVEGSVRKSSDTVRVTVQLIDAENGTHLWAETYDRNLTAENIFEIQDEITNRVSSTIADERGILWEARVSASREKPTENLEAYECVLRLFAYHDANTPERHLEVRDCAERAVETDPNYAGAWIALANAYLDEARFGHNAQPKPIERAWDAARRAVELDGDDALAREVLAMVYFHQRNLEAFRAEGERAILLNPNNSWVLANIGTYQVWTGELERGSALVKKAAELNPNHPGFYYLALSFTEYHRGNYEKAIEYALKINVPNFHWSQAHLAAAYGQLGRTAEGRATISKLLEIYPSFGEMAWVEYRKFNIPDELIERSIDGLRKAGLDVPAEAPSDG